MSFDTYLFDLDGTLVDTLSCIHEGVTKIMTSYGYTSPTLEEFLLLPALPMRDHFANLAKAEHVDPMVRELNEYEVNHISEVSIYPTVTDTLLQLKELKKKTGLVTSGSKAKVTAAIAHHGLDTLFDVVVDADDVTHRKPHPQPVYHALAQLGTDDHNAVLFVGDTPTDRETARRAGVTFAGVAHGKEMHKLKPDYLIHHLSDLLSI